MSAAIVVTVMSGSAAVAAPRVCSEEKASRIDSASEFCSCDRFSQEAIDLLRLKIDEDWYADVRASCPVRATFVMRGLRYISESETDSQSVFVQSGSPEDTTSTQLASADPSGDTTDGKDDNGHGNDADGVDESNPGGKR